MNGELRVCDACAHNTALYVAVCACGANMCGMDCLSGCRVNVFLFGVDIEFLVCDAYALKLVLFLAVCVDSVRGANVSGMNCVGVAV